MNFGATLSSSMRCFFNGESALAVVLPMFTKLFMAPCTTWFFNGEVSDCFSWTISRFSSFSTETSGVCLFPDVKSFAVDIVVEDVVFFEDCLLVKLFLKCSLFVGEIISVLKNKKFQQLQQLTVFCFLPLFLWHWRKFWRPKTGTPSFIR